MDTRISTSSLAEQIRQALREDIVSLRLPPGTKLHIPSLASHFGVSRTPVRDALQLLVEEGLVVMAPRVGCYVVELSPQDIREIAGVRKMIELYAFPLAMQNMPSEVVEALYRDTLALKTLPYEERRQRFAELDRQFHRGLISYTGNRRLAELAARTHAFVDLLRHLNVRVDGAVDEHLAILEAMRRGEAAEAQRLLEAHLDAVTEAILTARASA